MKTGFSPRKTCTSVYLMGGSDQYKTQLEKLRKHKHGNACPNINKLADIGMSVLEKLITFSYQHMSEKYD